MEHKKSRALAELLQSAKAMPVESSVDMAFQLSLLGLGGEERRPIAQTSLAHICGYMVHLSEVLPKTLNALANPSHWRAERLLDPATMTLRRPKIYLDAKITEHGTLYVSWGLVPTVALTAAHGSAKARLEASDFLCVSATWPLGKAPGDTIVRLTADEHPASRHFGRGDAENLLREEQAQRDTFQSFLAAMVRGLRAVLDVEIEDWVQYDADGSLQIVTLAERAHQLAMAQHAESARAFSVLAQQYEDTLARAGVTSAELRQAIERADVTETRLQAEVVTVTGRKANTMQLRACARAHESLTLPRASEARCREILNEAAAAI